MMMLWAIFFAPLSNVVNSESIMKSRNPPMALAQDRCKPRLSFAENKVRKWVPPPLVIPGEGDRAPPPLSWSQFQKTDSR